MGGLIRVQTLPYELTHPTTAKTPCLSTCRFRRLEWPIFEPENSIRILGADEHGQQRWSPLFADDGQASPMSDALNQPTTDPPRSRMRVVISDIHFSGSWQDDEALARCPAPLLIENRGGDPITVDQFIHQLSNPAAGLRDMHELIMGDIGGRMGPAVVPTASYAPDRRSAIAALPAVGAATRQGPAILRLASRSSETVQEVAGYRLMALVAAPTDISAWAPSMATAAPRVDGAVTPTATVWLAVRRNSVIAPEMATYRLTAFAEAPRAVFVLDLGSATAALRPDCVVTRTAIASLAAKVTSAHVLVVTSRLMALVGRTTVVKHVWAQNLAAVALPEAIVATKSIIVLKGVAQISPTRV
ncbi:hypothetical protein DL764_002863 [Monosporascus ibericus]|uniref:Uncharacterized protein n=1 Tax=Monosporascus ibericus TaxID=155417 RepID=A0A4Q4TIU6_9PEZI|nr:hypothetical protein DL764_002863 [Monosporascus ibericus]